MFPYQITKDFEAALRGYCGAPYAVAVNSCTAALLLACKWQYNAWVGRHEPVKIPAKTYPSVPMAAMQAGYQVEFSDEPWSGSYEIKPLKIHDSARRFTSGMYTSGFHCVSFSSSKILGLEQGGAILHNNREADLWFRKMRFDGRTEGFSLLEDTFDVIGYHCLMPPGIAAQLLLKLFHLPKHNPDLPVIDYPDLSLHPAFK